MLYVGIQGASVQVYASAALAANWGRCGVNGTGGDCPTQAFFGPALRLLLLSRFTLLHVSQRRKAETEHLGNIIYRKFEVLKDHYSSLRVTRKR